MVMSKSSLRIVFRLRLSLRRRVTKVLYDPVSNRARRWNWPCITFTVNMADCRKIGLSECTA